MSDRLDALEGRTHSGPRHIRVAERPQCPAHISHARYTAVPTGRPSRQALGLVAHVELGETAIEHPPRFNGASHHQQQVSASPRRVYRSWPVAGRFGEPERGRDSDQRFGYLAAIRTNGCQPIRHVGILGGITEPLTKLAGTRKGASVAFEPGPRVAIRQGPNANWKSSSSRSL